MYQDAKFFRLDPDVECSGDPLPYYYERDQFAPGVAGEPLSVLQPLVHDYLTAGKYEWLTIQRDSDDSWSSISYLHGVPNLSNRFWEFVNMETATGATKWITYLESRFLATGPKVFTPSYELFHSMLHVDLDIPLEDFKMPYPALLIQLPMEITQYALADLKMEPGYLLISTCGAAIIAELLGITKRGIFPFFGVTQQGETIAQTLQRKESPNGPLTVEQLIHACLNLCQLLTTYGTKLSYTSSKSRRRHERYGPNDLQVLLDPLRVAAAQEIKVYNAVKLVPRPEHQGGTHASPAPHWRRGHWRHLSEHKITFIPATFVNPLGDKVDLSQTNVVLQNEP